MIEAQNTKVHHSTLEEFKYKLMNLFTIAAKPENQNVLPTHKLIMNNYDKKQPPDLRIIS